MSRKKYSSANLDIFELDFISDDRQLILAVTIPSYEQFNRLSWENSLVNFEEYSLGLIAGGLIDGNIGLWNPKPLIWFMVWSLILFPLTFLLMALMKVIFVYGMHQKHQSQVIFRRSSKALADSDLPLLRPHGGISTSSSHSFKVARFLMKTVSQLRIGKQLVGTIAYMGRIKHLLKSCCSVQRAEDWLNPSQVFKAFEARAALFPVLKI